MPRVFVSYAHESTAHKEQVRALADFLTHRGITVDLDQWAGPARQDWGAWAVRHIEGADFVILVASPDMRVAGGGHAASDQRRGLQNEAAAVRDLLQRDRVKWLPRLLPVVLPGGSIDDIPLFMQPYSADHYVVDTIDDAGCENLLRVLTAQPRYVPPPLGTVPRLPPRPAPVLPTPGPSWTTLPAPVPVLWRADLVPSHDQARPSTVELHLVPAPSVGRCQVRRLERLAGELTALGRAGGPFTRGEPLNVGSSDRMAWAHGDEAGLVVTRDGQRSAWFPLPRAGEFGQVLDRAHLAGVVAGLLAALAGVELAAPDAVAPAMALDPVGLVREGRVGERFTSFTLMRQDRLRVEADETVRFTDLATHPADVADELVARLVSLLR